MKRTSLILAFLMLIVSHTASGVPARNGFVYLHQPDGSTFKAVMKGDEFTRIKTTIGGHAIIQDKDGWWCYAIYSEDGTKKSSGERVGDKVSRETLASSLKIPYTTLSETALRRRETARQISGEPILRRIRQSKSISTRSEDEGEAAVTKHGLILLVAFNDVRFRYTRDDFVRLLTEDGYSTDGATGSVKEYFNAQFNGKVSFDFQVSDIITVPRNRSYYGGNDADGTDKNPAEMVTDACKAADDDIDFSLFDDDDDGEVDNVFIFFAGADEAEGADEDCIWSHSWYVKSGAGTDLSLDGKRIDRYACSAELRRRPDAEGKIRENIAGIGTFCHEYSHTLGLVDFYDTDYDTEGGMAAGLWGSTSLMDSGNYNNNGNTPPYFNAVERWMLGIEEPVVLNETGAYRMSPVQYGKGYYMMETDNPDEFYLFECRAEEGWDKFIRGNGMLVYHIDQTEEVRKKWQQTNKVNSEAEHQCADLVEADGRADSFATTEDYTAANKAINGIFFPYGEVTSLTSETSPAIKFWSGARSTTSITGISREGADIKFNFLAGKDAMGPPTPVRFTTEAFADAAIIRFESSYISESEATVAWGRTGQDTDTLKISPYAPGKYACVLEGLEHTGKTYSVTVSFILNGMEGEPRSISFMTKRMPSVKWPYIYLGSVERNEDGSFPVGTRLPLRVYGASGAAEVTWSLDGNTITHDGDGYYTVPRSGVLEAEVHWEDGSTDIISKKLVITNE